MAPDGFGSNLGKPPRGKRGFFSPREQKLTAPTHGEQQFERTLVGFYKDVRGIRGRDLTAEEKQEVQKLSTHLSSKEKEKLGDQKIVAGAPVIARYEAIVNGTDRPSIQEVEDAVFEEVDQKVAILQPQQPWTLAETKAQLAGDVQAHEKKRKEKEKKIPKDKPRPKTTERSRPAAEHDARLSELAVKPVEEWSEEDKKYALTAAEKSRVGIEKNMEPMVERLRSVLDRIEDGEVIGDDPDTRKLLGMMTEIRAQATSVPVEMRERWLVEVTKKLSAEQVMAYTRARASTTTEQVAEMVRLTQQELEVLEGMPLPQEIALFRKEKPILEVLAILGTASTKVGIGIVEGGTLATFVLLLRQELWGHHFSFASPEHVASTLLITALATPFIEAGAHALVVDPVQREESIARSVGKALKRVPLAGAVMLGATGMSAVLQPHTLSTGLGSAAQTGDLGTRAREGQHGIERQMANLAPMGQGLVERVSDTEQEIIETEILGRQVEGRGGSGDHGIGPSAAFKIGFLLGKWDGAMAETYGAIPESAMDDFERGRAARQSLLLLMPQEERAGLEEASLSRFISERYAAFDAETADERALIAQRFKDLGATADEVDFWMGNPAMVKLALTIGFTPPGQRVIDDKVHAALEPLSVLQERHAQFIGEVGVLLEQASQTLTKASGGTEGAIEIEAEAVAFDTSALSNLEAGSALSLKNLGVSYELGAEKYFGGNDIAQVAAYSTAVYGIAWLLLFGSKIGFAYAHRNRYRRLKREADEQYEYTTTNKTGYLDRFSSLMSARLSALFANGGALLSDPVLKEQLQLATDREWIKLTPERVRVALMECIGEMKEVKNTGTQGIIEGFLHTYTEGVEKLLTRGTPPETIAQNAVTQMLRDHPELAARMVEKLLPGYFALERFLNERKDKDAPLTEREVVTFDSRLYPVIAGHLEDRLSIEETKLE